MDELIRCSNSRSMVVIIDEQEQIVGVATGIVSLNKDKFFVYNVLTTRPKIAKQMMQRFKTNFPGHTMEGMIRGTKHTHFNNIDKLINTL